MSTFNQRPTVRSAVRDATHEGGAGWRPSPHIELALLASCLYTNEDSFYESKADRMKRFVALVQETSDTKPGEISRLVRDLVSTYRIRNAAIVAAAEFAHSRVAKNRPSMVRTVIKTACMARPDGPTEFLAYWLDKFGKPIPRYVKAGLGDAARLGYTEKSALKYDSDNRKVRMGDLIELCHVKPRSEAQSALFQYLVSVRHRGDKARFNTEALPILTRHRELMRMPMAMRDQVPWDMLQAAGFTWEQYSSWVEGVMTAQRWETIIPSMPYMALMRNLRNFAKAGVSSEAVNYVVGRLIDPGEITRSRVFPYHMLVARVSLDNEFETRTNPTLHAFNYALGRALDHTVLSVTPMNNSLILVDCSASMDAPLSKRSVVTRRVASMLQATVLAQASEGCKVVLFGAVNKQFHVVKDCPVIETVRDMINEGHTVGHSTYGFTALVDHWSDSFERAVMFTDDQMHDSHIPINHIPWLYSFNVASEGPVTSWGKGRINVGGYSAEVFDAAAKLSGEFF